MRPILLQLGPIPLRSYGVMMILGFLLGLYRAVRVSKSRGIDSSSVIDVSLYSLLAGIVGARLVFILLNWQSFHRSFGEMFSIWEGGLSFHGGILFAVGVIYFYTRVKEIPFLALADLLAPSLALAYAVARIGCFLNGCCYGTPTGLPWGVSFSVVDDAHRHPTQLYAFLAGLLIFVALTRVEKWRKPNGYTFFSFLALYSVYRFLIEIIRRGATAEVVSWGLTEAQVVSAVMLTGSVVALWRLGRK